MTSPTSTRTAEAFHELPARGHAPQGPARTPRRRGTARTDDPRRPSPSSAPRPGPIAVPRADIEIDFDIEWDPDDQVYLWGALVHRAGAEPAYHPIVTWDGPRRRGLRRRSPRRSPTWLRDQIAAADAAGESLLVYHYSHPEPTYLKRLLGEDAVADLLDRFVDLLPIMREHYFGVRGLGIKQVAPAFGFAWRDDDPGGLQSQLWLIDARTAEDEAVRDAGRERILAYNEDDVRATAALRNGLAAG